jgi:ABC-type nitrate/sulfonate/bicarbonate transport system permease component
VAALTVAGWLDVQHLEAFASYRQPQDPSLGLQTPFTVAGFAAAFVVAVMAVVVVRYARASRQVADPAGRAFQPVFPPAAICAGVTGTNS